ncbi:Endonuclease YncB, thermonuclease family [Tenacibaculum sp. MAR_2009_124]|uniref:thermonuclease family protein n=1 Tax=Tenacibaculum sp. MAR_2009_124 TaxID=1250059 RepID=UPI00089D624D|nr:thermonuclease family protein [Tenacibaculum sp. MAR_2009_124]SEC67260.1 Endonuclease YncB, thermonuclease family [Tenacibaculum sp. MAR_2009_124]
MFKKRKKANKIRKDFLILIFIISSTMCLAQLKGKVVRVKDGDTIVILDKDNVQHTIRVADIDCPEYKQPFSKKAKQYVSDQIYLYEVEIKEKTIDRYGRIVAYVLYRGKNLSEELLKKGLAWHYVKYSDSDNFQELEDHAKTLKIGLWSISNPTAPWDWRKRR